MRAGKLCPEHEDRYDDCSFIHGERDLRAAVSLDWSKVVVTSNTPTFDSRPEACRLCGEGGGDCNYVCC